MRSCPKNLVKGYSVDVPEYMTRIGRVIMLTYWVQIKNFKGEQLLMVSVD